MKYHPKIMGVVLQCVLVIFLCAQSSFSQNSHKLQLPQRLQRSASWENAPRNYFDSKAIVQNAIPSIFRDAFASLEEFQDFAKTTLFAQLSDECELACTELIEQLSLVTSLPTENPRLPATWAIQMVDAWGKFPAGILSGHTANPGDFHECLQIRGNYSTTSNFKGKYCGSYLFPVEEATTKSAGNSNDGVGDANLRDSLSPADFIAGSAGVNGFMFIPFMGTCFPSSCTYEDIQSIFDNFHNETTGGMIAQSVASCYTDEKEPFDTADIAVIVLLSIIGLLCLAGSLFDLILFRRKPESVATSKLAKCFLAFSVPLNTEKLLNTKAGSGNMGCLDGLRFLSIAWVLLGHTFEMLYFQFTWNTVDIQNMYKSWTLKAVINGTVSVDTFFVISGFLMSYNLLRELDKTKGKFNYPLLVLHRFLRLTPTYMILAGITATILPYFGSGPQWNIFENNAELCQKYWWRNILYINNFYPPEEMCLGVSWYLSNDMQFFLFAPLIIYPLWRWRKVGYGILGALMVASIAAPATYQRVKELPPTNIIFIDQKTFVHDLYFNSLARTGTYVVGLALGYLLYYKSRNPGKFRNIPWWVVSIGWALSTVTAILVIFGVERQFDPANEAETFTSAASMAYAGLHRIAWGILVSWIIFACVSGYGGPVNRFLSWKIFLPLGRLTFCVYICSYSLQQLYHVQQTHPVDFSVYAMVTLYCAHMLMSCLLGYFLTITLEAPFIQLEKLLLPAKRTPSPAKANETELPTSFNNNNNNNNNYK